MVVPSLRLVEWQSSVLWFVYWHLEHSRRNCCGVTLGTGGNVSLPRDTLRDGAPSLFFIPLYCGFVGIAGGSHIRSLIDGRSSCVIDVQCGESLPCRFSFGTTFGLFPVVSTGDSEFGSIDDAFDGALEAADSISCLKVRCSSGLAVADGVSLDDT